MSKPERLKLPWSAEPYRPTDRQPILDFVRSFYGPIETADGAYFDWQYFSNPSGPAILWLARSPATQIVGQHALLPMRFLVDGTRATGCLDCNALVDPAYHGLRIWAGLGNKALDEAAVQGLHISYGIPNPNSYRPMIKEMHFQKAFDIPVLVKALDLGAAAQHVLGGWKGRLGGMAGSIGGPILFPRRRPRPGGARVDPVERFDAGFDRLAERSGRRYRLLLHRDAAHLNWRYVDCPTRTTRRWEVRRDNEVLGYAVLRITDFRGIRLGVLLDYLIDDSADARAAGMEILAHAEEAARAVGCPLMLTFALGHTAEFGLLHRAGWRVGPAALLPQPFPICVRPLNWPDTAPDMSDVRHWFVSTGDYDVF